MAATVHFNRMSQFCKTADSQTRDDILPNLEELINQMKEEKKEEEQQHQIFHEYERMRRWNDEGKKAHEEAIKKKRNAEKMIEDGKKMMETGKKAKKEAQRKEKKATMIINASQELSVPLFKFIPNWDGSKKKQGWINKDGEISVNVALIHVLRGAPKVRATRSCKRIIGRGEWNKENQKFIFGEFDLNFLKEYYSNAFENADFGVLENVYRVDEHSVRGGEEKFNEEDFDEEEDDTPQPWRHHSYDGDEQLYKDIDNGVYRYNEELEEYDIIGFYYSEAEGDIAADSLVMD